MDVMSFRDDAAPGQQRTELSAPWPIDLAHLRRYTMGDRQLEQEILGLFVEELPKTLAGLRKAQTAREWHVAAHTLKGSARAVGAWRLARAAQIAENHPITDDAEGAAKALASVEAAVAEATGYVRRMLAGN
jgi:HPt (histidine-containing phosphotransfer) domain-containing protein